MKYDVIIIGAGAAGLFCAANLKLNNKRGIIIDKGNKPGLKLLVSGAGQCNFTHSGDIRDFVNKYGDNGKKVRGILYKFANDRVIEYFKDRGLPVEVREDGKVFPKSMKAQDVVDLLLEESKKNGFLLKTGENVVKIQDISNEESTLFRVMVESSSKEIEYFAKNVVIAAGGISYPKTGSDGSIYKAMEQMDDLEIVPMKPALVPIYVEGYTYTDISGIAVRQADVSLVTDIKKDKRSNRGDILFTHRNFSGPGIIDFSRYLNPGDKFKIDYLPEGFKSGDTLVSDGISKSILNHLLDETGLPKAFIQEIIEKTQGVEQGDKTSSIAKKKIREIENIIRGEEFIVNGKAGLDKAMVTAGGVSLKEISTKTMESKKHPGLYFCGEVLDVDGNTGGYNIQFAFSSGYLAAQHISQLP